MSVRAEKYLFIIIILLALCLRIWGIGTAPMGGDKSLHVSAAKNYAQSGNLADEVWWHPPLKHLLLYSSIWAFGDNAYGYSMLNVISGTASVLMILVLGREFFHDRRATLFAGLLLCIDPTHIMLSRETFGEVPQMLFFMVAVFAIERNAKGDNRLLPLAGIFLGLAHAMKWYYIPAYFFLLAYAMIIRCKDKERTNAAFVLSCLLVLPVTLYLFSFYKWFGKRYGIGEFFWMHLDAYRELQALPSNHFRYYLSEAPSPLWWFLKPYIFGAKMYPEATVNRFHLFFTNFPFWMLTFPAALYTAVRAWKARQPGLALILLMFISTYIQFAFSSRPILLYSSLACMPFIILLVSFFCVELMNMAKVSGYWFWVLAGVTTLWGLYLYPLVTNRTVPVALYRLLLSLGQVY